MSVFTYQGDNINTLETYECDNIWWEHAENNEKEQGYRTK